MLLRYSQILVVTAVMQQPFQHGESIIRRSSHQSKSKKGERARSKSTKGREERTYVEVLVYDM